MEHVSDFTFADPQTAACPFPYYEAMRREEPVHFDPKIGMYLVSRYDDIAKVLRQPNLFSSVEGFAAQGAQDYTPEIDAYMEREGHGPFPMAVWDPPEHTRMRALMDKAFTAHRVASMERYITDIVDELIDGLASAGRAELVHDFAIPIPMNVIADQLGVDRADQGKFKIWSDAAVEPLGRLLTRERAFECARLMIEFQHYLKERIDERRTAPRDDMISDLVHATTDDPERPNLNLPELFAVIRGLLVAGNETTTNAIGSGVLLLIQNPGMIERLRTAPDLDKAYTRLCEEVLRLQSPVPGLPRFTTDDAEVGGTPIPKGSHVFLCYASGNRDEEKFDGPQAFDPERRNVGQHLAFGGGIHRCIGSMLARMEMKCAFRAIVERLDGLALAVPESELAYVPNLVSRGLATLPVSFKARGTEAATASASSLAV